MPGAAGSPRTIPLAPPFPAVLPALRAEDMVDGQKRPTLATNAQVPAGAGAGAGGGMLLAGGLAQALRDWLSWERCSTQRSMPSGNARSRGWAGTQ